LEQWLTAKRLYRDGCDNVLKCSPRLSTSHAVAVLIQIRFGAWAGNSPGHEKLLIFAPPYFVAVEPMQGAWLPGQTEPVVFRASIGKPKCNGRAALGQIGQIVRP
jgi:hypothetical protein